MASKKKKKKEGIITKFAPEYGKFDMEATEVG
jgi:hypothetical protein